jgi:hypothetical protein
VDDIRSRLVLHSPIPSSYSILFSFFPSIFPPLATPPTSIYHIVQRGLVSFAMLLKNFLFLGLAVFSAASPILGHLETRAKTSTAVGTKTGSKGKSGGTTCPNSNAITGATCAGAKFTAVDIEKAVKQAKAMKVKGKTGNGLHFPAKYKPSKETKAKGVKISKGSKASKAVRREENALQARRARGGSKTKTQPKTTRPKKTPKKKTPKKTTPEKTPKKETPKKTKDNCKAGSKTTKVGKGVCMFPILDTGV